MGSFNEGVAWQGMVRPDLMEFDYYKILEPLKGAPNVNHFLQKKDFKYLLLRERELQNNEAYQNF